MKVLAEKLTILVGMALYDHFEINTTIIQMIREICYVRVTKVD